MKKQLFIILGLSFVMFYSCGDNKDEENKKSTNSEVNLDKILQKLEENETIDSDTRKAILNEYNRVKDSTKRENANNGGKFDSKNSAKVNSLKIFEDIHKDRSLYLQNYTNKSMIITDLLVKNVKTIDVDGKFVKMITAIPCNLKNKQVGVSFDFDSYDVHDYYYKNQYLIPFYKLASDDAIEIELKNPDELKKLNMLEWEYNAEDNPEGDNYIFNRIISVGISGFEQDDITYEEGRSAENDMKAYQIKLKLQGAEIIK